MSPVSRLDPKTQEAHYEHFGELGPDIARMDVRRLSLGAWDKILPGWVSCNSFSIFWGLGLVYGQNVPQEIHFEYVLSTLGAWAQICLECSSGDSF